MENNAGIIDFIIIWKKIHGKLNHEEEGTFENWLSADKDHQRFFEKAKAYYTKEAASDVNLIDSQKAFLKVKEQIDFQTPKKNDRFIAYATAIAACIVLLIASYFVFNPLETKAPAQVSQVNLPITPGTDKAILLMDDGTSYDISLGQNLKVEEGGAEIKSEGTSLEYIERKGSSEETKYNTLITPQGGQFALTLTDGTKVWLNAGSTLKYPTHFSGKERKVELSGEAYFEVAKNAQMPFSVYSGEQVVEVLGTSFNISSYQDNDKVLTTLVEGEVKVFLEEKPEIKENLLPKQQSVFVKGSEHVSQRTVDVEPYIAWKDGWFYFQDDPLENIMQTLSRWYDVDIKFKKEEARQLKFTGKIKRYESLEEVLNLLEKTNEVTFKIERRFITVE